MPRSANPPMTMGLNRAPAREGLLKIVNCLAVLSRDIETRPSPIRFCSGKVAEKMAAAETDEGSDSCWC
jgi:hypothetical protein